jgi:hypothetical protein
MPARRDWTPEQLAERLDKEREQARVRMARWRERHRNGVTVTPIDEGTPVPVTVPVTNGVTGTPPTPARHSVPPQTENAPLPPKGGSPRTAPLAVPKPNKSGELIDLLRAAGVECELLEKHHAALKRTRLSAAEVAEVYIAIAEGRFGDDWLCDNVNVERAIAAWPNYQNRKLRGPRRPRPGRSESPSAIAERLFAGVGG